MNVIKGITHSLVGIIILESYPISALWAIGVLVGVELQINGWTLVMLSLALRDAPSDEDSDS